MKDQVIDIETLQQDDHNFNKGTEAGRKLMEKSFTELGAGRSILVDKTGRIIAGNKSQKAAIAAGIRKVRVIETDGTELIAVKRTDVDLDSKKGRELALADNLTTQVNLEWDKVELEAVGVNWGLDELEESPISPTDIGLQEVETADVQEDEFDEEKDEVQTICQTGDIWQLGNHRLMCGDSTKAEDVAMLMKDEKADLWLTDPPYNVDYAAARRDILDVLGAKLEHKDIANDNMAEENFERFLLDAYKVALGFLKAGGSYYIWHTQGYPMTNFINALRSCGVHFHQQLIWVKNHFVFGRMDYQGKHEPCLYGWKEGAAHYFVDLRNETTIIPDAEEIDIDKMSKSDMAALLHKIYESKIPSSIMYEDRPLKSELHPTMKPIKLFARLIRNSSRPNEIVLDTFGGSGTTIVACEELHRSARLMELDPHYCDVIIARWEKLTGQKAVKLN